MKNNGINTQGTVTTNGQMNNIDGITWPINMQNNFAHNATASSEKSNVNVTNSIKGNINVANSMSNTSIPAVNSNLMQGSGGVKSYSPSNAQNGTNVANALANSNLQSKTSNNNDSAKPNVTMQLTNSGAENNMPNNLQNNVNLTSIFPNNKETNNNDNVANIRQNNVNTSFNTNMANMTNTNIQNKSSNNNHMVPANLSNNGMKGNVNFSDNLINSSKLNNSIDSKGQINDVQKNVNTSNTMQGVNINNALSSNKLNAVNQIIVAAVNVGADDIHFDPTDNEITVKLKKDNVLDEKLLKVANNNVAKNNIIDNKLNNNTDTKSNVNMQNTANNNKQLTTSTVKNGIQSNTQNNTQSNANLASTIPNSNKGTNTLTNSNVQNKVVNNNDLTKNNMISNKLNTDKDAKSNINMQNTANNNKQLTTSPMKNGIQNNTQNNTQSNANLASTIPNSNKGTNTLTNSNVQNKVVNNNDLTKNNMISNKLNNNTDTKSNVNMQNTANNNKQLTPGTMKNGIQSNTQNNTQSNANLSSTIPNSNKGTNTLTNSNVQNKVVNNNANMNNTKQNNINTASSMKGNVSVTNNSINSNKLNNPIDSKQQVNGVQNSINSSNNGQNGNVNNTISNNKPATNSGSGKATKTQATDFNNKLNTKNIDFSRIPVVDAVNQIIITAVNVGASDIHFDPTDNGITVRLRVDGVLNDYFFIPFEIKQNATTRIKIMAGMNITETRLPQDGGIRDRINGRDLDLRVSSLPTKRGEKIVIRILDYSMSLKGIEYLYFSETNYNKILKMLNNPNGIILVTGATGTGKSTTLYSFLQKLNVEGTNIITVEDPVEMDIAGINQVQVNSDIGLDFAAVLRSILRQDPNIIMIGEIRDSETAKIAVRASITGHLVLSTIHTNNSLNTIERLLDMDVERYLLASALTGIVSQQLARKLCDKCKTKRKVTTVEKSLFESVLGLDVSEVFEPNKNGCPNCSGGYKGRVALHEVLLINQDIRDAISSGMRKEQLRELVYNKDVITMLQDGLYKVMAGFTTVSEILKLIEVEDEDFGIK